MKSNIYEKLAIHGGSKIIEEENNAKYSWPIIDKEVEKVVIEQLHDTLSIYNRSGVFAEFEDLFAKYHNQKYALLTNSGTSALFGLYEGLNLQPGDEVICPAYTFFATVSPIIYTGATPVFCDCDQHGNICPLEIERKITNKTKAVMITHMWGIPCNMDSINMICQQNNIHLLEDCSHAHGAKYKGKTVGSFGTGAAWSLQGQKIISGGEGGILLTNSKDIFSRALLQGHYNKRCKQEISKNDPLYKFATTGIGQKFRAHPIAIAIALQQFKLIDKYRKQRNEFASKIINSLSEYDFLKMPNITNREPSWYAFVMQYDETKTKISRKKFVECLQAEGLIEIDMPGSTGPIHNLPLFTQSNVIMPRLYKDNNSCNEEYPNAAKYYNSAIKMPIWARKQDEAVVNSYIKGLAKVANVVKYEPRLILENEIESEARI